MYSKQNGYIFIFILIFLQVGVLLSCYAYTQAITHFKLADQSLRQTKKIVLANAVLDEVAISLSQRDNACMVAPLAPEALMQQSFTWWQAVACGGELHATSYY